jgi:long-chain acyl-CoA synthetase
MFGGNVQKMLVGSSPISGDTLSFFKVVLGIHIHEAYGQTEVSAPGTLTHPLDPTAGHVGGPPPQLKIRLKDVPEMGYLSTDNPPKGEV